MQAAILPQELSAAAPGLAAGLRAILTGLATLIARAFLRDPLRVGLIVPLWTRLTRAARRFDRLMARVARGANPRPKRSGTGSGPAPCTLPAGHGWLIDELRHEAVVYALRLERLLADPAAAAILAQTPQAARLLRPLCRMLGISPAVLRPASARQSAGRTVATQPPVRRPAGDNPAGQSQTGDAPLPPPRPLHETVPCPHVFWPWFPRKSARLR